VAYVQAYVQSESEREEKFWARVPNTETITFTHINMNTATFNLCFVA
jgi:hypothetical protein